MLAASIFHLGEFTVAEAKERLAAAGVPVRPAYAAPPGGVGPPGPGRFGALR